MKKPQNKLLSLFSMVCFITLIMSLSGNFVYAEESTYSHISYVDTEATVIRTDQTEHRAVANLPVAPGDQVVTGAKGRCELQFDNGTIIRLDKNTRLKVTTVLAPSLTSRWKITTLHLMEGQIHAMNQSYNREMFQVVTPNAAIDLKKRSAVTIRVKDNGDTFAYADKGKLKVMYGGDEKSLKTATIASDKGYTIAAGHQLREGDDSRDFDFKSWNDYVTRNFKDLHHGISKLPKKISRNPALMYWTEKWSSLFGEWVYDELFGYIWRPYDEFFALSARPFFHADYVEVNGQTFVVPQQPWGWIPAHLGTWIWTKSGWTWIPGEAFSPGLGQFSFLAASHAFPTFSCWMYRVYGSYDLYYTYRHYGVHAWRAAYRKVYNRDIFNPSFDGVPGEVRDILKKMNRTPVKTIKERLGKVRQLPSIDVKRLKDSLIKTKSPVDTAVGDKPVTVKPVPGTSSTVTVKPKSPNVRGSVPFSASKRTTGHPGWSDQEKRLSLRGKAGGPARNFRDWNPDVRWALRTGNEVRYSSKTNEVICPNLKLSSRSISPLQRRSLTQSASPHRGGYVKGSSTSSSSGDSGTSVSSTSGFGANKGSGAGSKSGGKEGGNKK